MQKRETLHFTVFRVKEFISMGQSQPVRAVLNISALMGKASRRS